LNFLGSNVDIDGHGTTEKVQPQRCFAKGTASLLEIRVCLGEKGRIQDQIKAALAKKPNATVYSYSGQRYAFSRLRALQRGGAG